MRKIPGWIWNEVQYRYVRGIISVSPEVLWRLQYDPSNRHVNDELSRFTLAADAKAYGSKPQQAATPSQTPVSRP